PLVGLCEAFEAVSPALLSWAMICLLAAGHANLGSSLGHAQRMRAALLAFGVPRTYSQRKTCIVTLKCVYAWLTVANNSPTRTLMPSSSLISRLHAPAGDSPGSILPPANSHNPPSSPAGLRCAINRRPPFQITPTAMP